MLLLTYTALTGKKGEKEKERIQLIHKRVDLLYMETNLPKAGPQEP